MTDSDKEVLESVNDLVFTAIDVLNYKIQKGGDNLSEEDITALADIIVNLELAYMKSLLVILGGDDD